jgi:hypothetical protein
MEAQMWKAAKIETQDKLSDQELDSIAGLVLDLELNHRIDLDSIRLEIATIKLFLSEFHPEFDARYPLLKERVRSEISP